MKRLAALLLLLACGNASAEQVRRGEGFEIHYNAFRADFLPESVSAQHGLTRAADRGLLNVTVLRARSDGTMEAIEAEVRALVHQGRATPVEVRMRPVREPGSVSYMGAFKLEGEAPYAFELDVTPFGASSAEAIRFRQAVAAQ